MKRFLGSLISILIIATLFVAIPTSTIAIDSEHRDLLQSVIDNTESLDTKYVIGYYDSSGLQTIDAAIKASAGHLGGVLIITDGTSSVSLILYDDPDSAEGTVLFKATVAGGDDYGGVMFSLPIKFLLGCWADIEGTGTNNYIVYYR